MSQELITLPSLEVEQKARFKELSKHVEFTIIANRHADVEDAERSTSVIEPDSIVFVEGYSKQTGASATDLIGYLRSSGITDDSFLASERDFHLQTLDETPEDESDFSQHQAQVILNLIDKHCAIFNADFRPVEGIGEEGDKFRDTMFSAIDLEARLYEKFGEQSYARELALMLKADFAKFAFHGMREHFARALVLTHTEAALQREKASGQKQFARTVEGKVRAYIIYGAAHARSLQHGFGEVGVMPEVNALADISESDSLEHHLFMQNRHRRLAYNALKYAGLLGGKDSKEKDELYASLEKYNDLPKDEVTKLLLSTIHIAMLNRDKNVDDDRFYRELESFMRTFDV